LDIVDLNKAIILEHYPMPVLDDIVPELSGSDLFTKFDVKDGYCNVKFAKKSSFLTTFIVTFDLAILLPKNAIWVEDVAGCVSKEEDR